MHNSLQLFIARSLSLSIECAHAYLTEWSHGRFCIHVRKFLVTLELLLLMNHHNKMPLGLTIIKDQFPCVGFGLYVTLNIASSSYCSC